MALVILLAVATLLFSTFSCYPVRYFWDLAVPGGKCLDREALYLGIGSINIATDLLILVLPTFMLKDLTIPKLQKMFLIVITSLGGTACIASILRLPTLIIMFQSPDSLWNDPDTAE